MLAGNKFSILEFDDNKAAKWNMVSIILDAKKVKTIKY